MRSGAFTTGEIAKMLGFSPACIRNWCKRGLLPHFKVPGGKYRKVTEDQLLAFCKQHGLPIPPEIAEPPAQSA